MVIPWCWGSEFLGCSSHDGALRISYAGCAPRPGWTNCLPLTGKLDAEELVSLGAILCVRKEPSLCWMISVARSRQHSPLHCPPVRSARPANTRSPCGGDLHDSWNIPNLS